MQSKMIGIELVGTANALRRMTFQDSYENNAAGESPTSMQQWFLSYIWQHQSSNDVFQKDIEEAFKVRRSTATEILKAMERKKLIVRTSLPEDKRKKKILLTDSAINICQDNWEKIVQTERQIVNGLTQEEINTFIQVLGKIQNNLDTD